MIPAAKPTMYRSTQFRSRLEARWAAFFDHAGWAWKYEPIDLEKWTPDFLLKGAANALLVEVKPIEWIGNDAEQVLQAPELEKVRKYRSERQMIDGVRDELLVLGDGPQCVGSDWVLGAFVDESFSGAPDWAVLHGGPEPMELDFCAQRGAFAYRMSGAWDGNAHIQPMNDNDLPRLMWEAAGNATRWRAPNPLGPVGPILRGIVNKARDGGEQ